ncbi:hypothetical protein [Chitinimonas lacunae]|uniref:Molecular chaperone n=1 Tax=Chitinimonas lacunae TaxID=1963018 RepID=A0ABV8MS66_9NEIS
MSLALAVPQPVTNRNLVVETNPKALKAWLVSLPHANLHETSRAIFDALTSLNRVRLPDDERLRLLEHYQVSIDMLDAPLEAAYTSAAVPVKDKTKQAATLARNLQLELANGYKLVLTERANVRFSLGNKHIPELAQRLMCTYQKLVWVCCKSYAQIPAGVWLEAHTLFRYAIQHKMIDAPAQAQNPMQTIGGLYKQMLLMALADPYRYHPAELDKIQDLIRNYGSAAQFQPLTATPSPAGFFLIRLDSDTPPVFLGQRPVDVQPSNAILLDTIEMAKLLHKALQAVEQKAPTAPDKAKALAWLDLLRRVTRQWSIAPKRVFQRIRANSQVEIAGGLRMTAFCFNGMKPQTQPVLIDAPSGIEVSDSNDTPSPQAVSGPAMGSPDQWLVLNESPGGFAVRLAPIPQHCVYRVGDVVGLLSQGGEGWLVACVRWMQTVDEGEAIEMGVQVLAPRADPAMLRPVLGPPSSLYQSALLLPEVQPIQQPAMILAARGTFSPLRELSVFVFDGELRVRATKLIEQSIGYDLFEFTPA